ncbi:hypothetical protein QMK33_00260 [Hymenobacter sp. H14-R3]|uniref:hypothetical protein n=1 Tax=Hymenobacter sp. H14-R3 TaxID=3046308 RepID=UPI0024B90284|nr:hypothetical protein [Hymenobacter sp. H14-R3]MDJ0363566.1 hypothetical protein [Hymenobacter sp. H14-R3]
MALNKLLLKEHLNRLYDDQATREADPAKARADFVDGLADAFDEYVRSGTVTGTVTTTGTAAAQKGIITSASIQ